MVYFFLSESYRAGNCEVGMISVTITLNYVYIGSSLVTVSFLFY